MWKHWQNNVFHADVRKYVFLDESGSNIDLTRNYGYAKGGERVFDNVPLGTPTNTTTVASMRLDGSITYNIYCGGTTKERFLNYIQNTLIPTLKPGDVVIMDNFKTHHSKEVRNSFLDFGIIPLYMPAYSPDLNPIELMWSKVKSILRTLKVRSVSTLIDAIKDAISTVTPENCEAWFRKAGYLNSNNFCPFFD